MANGTIKFDYDATMQTAQQLTTIQDLVKDAQGRSNGLTSTLAHWDGEAAREAKESLREVIRVLKGLDTNDHKIIDFLQRVSQAFTSWDETEAKKIKSSWHDVDKTSGKTH